VAALSRTNLALFGNAIQLRAKEIQFQFERDLQPTLYRTLDVFERLASIFAGGDMC